MKINNIDISTFGAKQFRVTYGHRSLNNSSEWNIGMLLPYLSRNNAGFQTLTVTVNLFGSGRQNIIRNRSALLAACKDPVDLTLDKWSHKFRGILTGHRETEVTQGRWHQMELTFDGYEYSDIVEFTKAADSWDTEVDNPGNLRSPCIVEVTPQYDCLEITLSGICKLVSGVDAPVVLDDVRAGHKVVLDGISGLITEDGALKEVDIWQLPAMDPGVNTVTVDNKYMDITVKVLPLYM